MWIWGPNRGWYVLASKRVKRSITEHSQSLYDTQFCTGLVLNKVLNWELHNFILSQFCNFIIFVVSFANYRCISMNFTSNVTSVDATHSLGLFLYIRKSRSICWRTKMTRDLKKTICIWICVGKLPLDLRLTVEDWALNSHNVHLLKYFYVFFLIFFFFVNLCNVKWLNGFNVLCCYKRC